MGGSYCLSIDQNCYQNEQTVNVQISEEYLEEKNMPQTSNITSQKKINATEAHSNNNINNLKNIKYHSNINNNNLQNNKKNNQTNSSKFVNNFHFGSIILK